MIGKTKSQRKSQNQLIFKELKKIDKLLSRLIRGEKSQIRPCEPLSANIFYCFAESFTFVLGSKDFITKRNHLLHTHKKKNSFNFFKQKVIELNFNIQSLEGKKERFQITKLGRNLQSELSNRWEVPDNSNLKSQLGGGPSQ